MLLSQRSEGHDTGAAIQPEITDFRNEAVECAAHHLIEDSCGGPLENSVTFSADPLRRNDIVALTKQSNHVRQDFRGILQICIHNNYGVTRRKVQAGSYSGLVTKVTAEDQDFYPRIRQRRLRQYR